jgi:N-acetylglutamate synthase
VIIREAAIADYTEMRALWENSPGVRLIPADSEASIAAFLRRNPGMSFMAAEGDELVGTSLCGHDGRRGYIYHVAVKPAYRGKGTGTRLVEASLAALRREGIDKCHAFVLADNPIGNAFWSSFWKKREDILLYSKDV